MGNKKKRELAVGVVFLLIGIVYLYLTTTIPRKQFVDAAFVPYVLAITLCGLGILQLRGAARLADSGSSAKPDDADYPTVWKTLGLIVAYAALLEPAGFPIMTVVYLVAQFIVLTPPDKKVSIPQYTVIAVVTSLVVYLTFRYAFDMLLPLGPLSAFMD